MALGVTIYNFDIELAEGIAFSRSVSDPDDPTIAIRDRAGAVPEAAFRTTIHRAEGLELYAIDRTLPEGSVVGTAGVGRGTYFGPGAPAGPRFHHYVFELPALSATLNLPADATRAPLLDAMKEIIVGKSAYVGRLRQ
jgi:hypothetical protein